MAYMKYVVICRTKYKDGSKAETFVFGPMDCDFEAADLAQTIPDLQRLIDEDKGTYIVDDAEVTPLSSNWKLDQKEERPWFPGD